MIVEQVVNTVVTAVTFVLGLFPTGDPLSLPDLSTALGAATTLWPPMATMIGLGLVTLGIHMALTAYVTLRAVARWLPSWLTGGG